MTYTNKNADEIYDLYEQHAAEYVWIDVREPEEWTEGTIPNIQRIPMSQIAEQLMEWDASKKYILVCRSGNRSGRICQAMQSAGFDKLINFDGGMLAWYDAGYPVE